MSTVHVRNIPIEIRSIGSVSSSRKGRIILPPSIGHGEGSAGHRIASSCEALLHTSKLPSIPGALAIIFEQRDLNI